MKRSNDLRSDRPRDGKREPRARTRDNDRRAARRAKYTMQGRKGGAR